jgi:hypothetical protein
MGIWVSCDHCRGTGSVTTYQQRKCDDCNGQGQVLDFYQPWNHLNDGPRQPGYKICGGCYGSGLKGGNYQTDCAYCYGRGRNFEPDDDDSDQPPRPRQPVSIAPPHPTPPSSLETYELNWLGKFLVFLFKAGLVYFVLMFLFSIPALNEVVHKVPIWFANSGAKEALKKIPAWFSPSTPAPAIALGYPPVKGTWAGNVECGKNKGNARLILNGPVSERVEAQFQLQMDGEARVAKHSLKLEGRLVNNKLRLEGSKVYGKEGYYVVQVTIDFIDFRPTAATGVLGSPGCDAVRLALTRN